VPPRRPEITNQLAAKHLLPLNSFAKIRLLKGRQSISARMAAIRHAAIHVVGASFATAN